VSGRSLRRLSTRTRAAFERHRRTIRYARLKEELFDPSPDDLAGEDLAGGVRAPDGVMGTISASPLAASPAAASPATARMV